MKQNRFLEVVYSDKNAHPKVDTRSLAREIKKNIKGEVRFDAGYRALYATDASNYRMDPLGVVIPKDKQDIIKTVELAKKFNAPILSRGGGTSLAGQCTNTAVVMDMTKYYHGVLDVDPDKKMARVLPGTILDSIREKTIQHGLVFGPDPATHNHCAIGGMIGNNSCGIHSVMSMQAGKGARTSDNLHSMEVLTYDGHIMKVGPTTEEELEKIIANGGKKGEIYKKLKDIRDKYGDLIRERFPKIPRRVSGYNLDELLPENGFNVARALSGTEGTCATFLEATIELIPQKKERGLLLLGYPDVYAAGYHITEVLKLNPIGLEGIDVELVNYMEVRGMKPEKIKLLPEGKGWLVVEFGANTKDEVKKLLEDAKKKLEKLENPPKIEMFTDEHKQEDVWDVRESGLGATAFVPNMGDTWTGWEDTAVPPEKIGDYMHDLRGLFNKYGYEAALYGHFGQGLIHCRINFDLVSAEGLKNYKDFVSDATDLVISYGGSYSGEHGDGQARAEFLEKMYGPELMQAFKEFKNAWDPENKMNPGKIIDPNPMLSHLRLGMDYNPNHNDNVYHYPEDEDKFSRAVLRCVGVGKCRRHDGGTMCPSYMVTREEMHSTRGRAHLLFEMTRNKSLVKGWKDETIKESLDLCLSCKGCKNDCPVNVDVATYKSEFLSHYYKGKLRPLHAYLFGFIAFWARISSKMPTLTNFMLHAPGLSWVIKKIAGIAHQREMPKFAKQTFKHWFFKEIKNNPPENKRVIFWADTFNNYFHTEVAKSAIRVLIDAGWHVVVPKAHLCCGRPLYDYGMLNTAKRWLQEIIADLRTEIRQGVPVVGIEPSCVATFRDELKNLFPADEDAQRLSKQTYLFSEFLDKKDPEYQPPIIKRKALVHGHCQHKAVIGMDAEINLMKKMQLDFKVLDSGCCGMAGAFGFESKKYDISKKAGERVLLPAVRKAKKDELIIANGFSCKEQIKQESTRKALHIAQVMDMALQQKNGEIKRQEIYEEEKSHAVTHG